VLLAEHGIDSDPAAGTLVLRRILGADGRSRAFIDDAPASVGLLRQVGDMLVEIQGQFEQHGLLDPATHRDLLDAFGGYEGELAGDAADGKGAARALAAAARLLERARERAAGLLDPALAAIERASVETQEAIDQLGTLLREDAGDAGNADKIEERLFALRAL